MKAKSLTTTAKHLSYVNHPVKNGYIFFQLPAISDLWHIFSEWGRGNENYDLRDLALWSTSLNPYSEGVD